MANLHDPHAAGPDHRAPAAPYPPLLACLCAAWCDTCAAYRPLIDALAHSHPHWQVVWVDIEDQADALAGLPGGEPDIGNFPTLLVCTDDGHGFFGPVLPHERLLKRMLQQAEQAELQALDAAALALASLLRSGRLA